MATSRRYYPVDEYQAQAMRDFMERVWPSLEFRPSGCWIWTGARRGGNQQRCWRDDGAIYGTVRVRGENVYVHRLAREAFHGRIPDGMHVDHRRECESSLCCNPVCVAEAVPPAVNTARAMEKRAANGSDDHWEEYF